MSDFLEEVKEFRVKSAMHMKKHMSCAWRCPCFLTTNQQLFLESSSWTDSHLITGILIQVIVQCMLITATSQWKSRLSMKTVKSIVSISLGRQSWELQDSESLVSDLEVQHILQRLSSIPKTWGSWENVTRNRSIEDVFLLHSQEISWHSCTIKTNLQQLVEDFGRISEWLWLLGLEGSFPIDQNAKTN